MSSERTFTIVDWVKYSQMLSQGKRPLEYLVLCFLAARPGSKLLDIATTGCWHYASVTAALGSLSKRGFIVRVKHGCYRVAGT